jgi:epoxyqueuosine reductase QueG
MSFFRLAGDIMTSPSQPWNEIITQEIVSFLAQPQNNHLGPPAKQTAWQEPLVGFAAGDDPLFFQFKQDIGSFFWLPQEVFALAFPHDPAPASELTVIAWILPQTDATKESNRGQKVYPSELWARARLFGEDCNRNLRNHLEKFLQHKGVPAAAPQLAPQWRIEQSPRFGRASTWSERHAAHACGLGTFGLCDGLITAKGKAVRVGSVVARIEITPTPRPYDHYQAYCLYASEGICGECIRRCPVKALSEKGHDKVRCRAHLMEACKGHIAKHYGLDVYGCGLCQTGVPCESGIPDPASF